MGWSDFIRKFQVPNVTIVEHSSDYDIERVGSIQIPDSLRDDNAFNLASTVAEIYTPIDFLADRASKLKFFIADKNGNPVSNELNRFLTDINPLYTFSDLFYQAVFSYLADGNLYLYQNVPSLYKTANSNNIARIDVLNPNFISFNEYTNLSKLDIIKPTDFIKKVEYNDGKRKDLDKEKLFIFGYDWSVRDNSNILCKSPLFKSYRSINNLLATYSARYNVYANNGSAGYISKKSNPKNELEETLNPIDREAILKDIESRNGITGKRHIIGISSVPIEFINTLADIQKLMPFEETLEDSIKIAGTFQIPANLVSRKDQSTFDNQREAERSVWENTLMSVVDTVAGYFTKAAAMKDYSIKADYSTVSALTENEIEKENLITAKLDNLAKAKALDPNFNTSELIYQLYGKENK